MQGIHKNEIGISGATGQSGRALDARSAAANLCLVLAGWGEARLRKVAAASGGGMRIFLAS